eukprot:TRINITY_DN3921_c0_g2_i1.p1 TRINITY_DN3921_c0_g2~~TRINITY_DN3921_c0_g2_i1.p1  ORF type:complete len:569 (-),score=43.17 TRINITY_DN3921_c0_g2_i1:3409-5073(-)
MTKPIVLQYLNIRKVENKKQMLSGTLKTESHTSRITWDISHPSVTTVCTSEDEVSSKARICREICNVTTVPRNLADPSPIAIIANKFAKYSCTPIIQYIFAEYRGASKVEGEGPLSIYTYIYALFLIYLEKATKGGDYQKKRLKRLKKWLTYYKFMLSSKEINSPAICSNGGGIQPIDKYLKHLENIISETRKDSIAPYKHFFPDKASLQKQLIQIGMAACLESAQLPKFPKEKGQTDRKLFYGYVHNIMNVLERIATVLKIDIKVFILHETEVRFNSIRRLRSNLTVCLLLDEESVHVLYNCRKRKLRYSYSDSEQSYHFKHFPDWLNKLIVQNYSMDQLNIIAGINARNTYKDCEQTISSLCSLLDTFYKNEKKYKHLSKGKEESKDNIIEERVKYCTKMSELFKVRLEKIAEQSEMPPYHTENLKTEKRLLSAFGEEELSMIVTNELAESSEVQSFPQPPGESSLLSLIKSSKEKAGEDALETFIEPLNSKEICCVCNKPLAGKKAKRGTCSHVIHVDCNSEKKCSKWQAHTEQCLFIYSTSQSYTQESVK